MQIRDVRAGLATVVCVTVTPSPREMCKLPIGPWLTSKHLVRLHGAWVVPQGVIHRELCEVDVVCNSVRSRGHSVLVDYVVKNLIH